MGSAEHVSVGPTKLGWCEAGSEAVKERISLWACVGPKAEISTVPSVQGLFLCGPSQVLHMKHFSWLQESVASTSNKLELFTHDLHSVVLSRNA